MRRWRSGFCVCGVALVVVVVRVVVVGGPITGARRGPGLGVV